MATFEMFKPKMKSGKIVFDIKPLTDSGKDTLAGLQDIEMSDISLFIDDKLEDSGLPSCFPSCRGAKLSRIDLSKKNLFTNFHSADLSNANLRETDLTGANLRNANLWNANLTGALHNSGTTWPAAEEWSNTTCPDGTNSNDPGNATCGF